MHDPDKERQDGESGFARWSRRKAAARSRTANAIPCAEDTKKPTVALADMECAPAPASDLVPVSASEPATEPPPDPEHLDASADFSVFLRAGIAPALRCAALRRLWTLDPVFSYQDGLVEYGEDFTDSAKASLSVRTVYRIVSNLAQNAEGAEPNFESNASKSNSSGESAATDIGDDSAKMQGSATTGPGKDGASETQRSAATTGPGKGEASLLREG